MTEIIPYPTPKTSPVLVTGMDEDVTMHHFGKYNQDSYFYLAPTTWAGYSTLHDIATRYHNTEPTMGKKAKAFFISPAPLAYPSLILIPIAALFAPGSILLAILPEDAGSMVMVLILFLTVTACMGSVSAIDLIYNDVLAPSQDSRHRRFIDDEDKNALWQMTLFKQRKTGTEQHYSLEKVQRLAEEIVALTRYSSISHDTTYFAQAYDSYMATLVFLETNKDAISDELAQRYRNDLTTKAKDVKKESDELKKLEKEIEEIAAKNNNKAAEIAMQITRDQQSNRDNLALSVMPLKEKD